MKPVSSAGSYAIAGMIAVDSSSGAWSAWAIWRALEKRSCGPFSVARSTQAARWSGTSGAASRGSGIASVRWRIATATKPSPLNGSRPVRHS